MESKGGRRKRRVPSGAALLRPDKTDTLIRSFFREWIRTGYRGISLERVARRAGVGKAALYRRWPNRAAMAADALKLMGMELVRPEDSDTLAEDLAAFLHQLRRVLRKKIVRAILLDLHAEKTRSPELAPVIRQLTEARRDRGKAIFVRAAARGEIALESDVDLLADLLAAPMFWRLAIVEGDVGDEYLSDVLRLILGAAGYSGERSAAT